jgi:hypothetical protein
MAHPPWTNEFLNSMRLIGDDAADQLIKDLFATHQIGAVNSMMRTLVENDRIPEGSIPENLRNFLQSVAILPPWTDMEKIRAAENLFWLHGPAIVLLLFCYSLPFTYAAREEAQALARTGRLTNDPNRRVAETAQMIIDVMAPGGLAGSGTGVRTAQKVRLMHAGVRFQILASKQWPPQYGYPLNQEDLAGTLMSFSVIVLDGLSQLNISVSEAEAEAYLHCWNVVGHILGLKDEMIPENLTEAVTLAKAFRVRQFAECDEGKMMAKALLDLQAHILPGNVFDLIPRALTHHFIGEKMANILEVPAVPFDDVLFRPLQRSNVIADDILKSSGWLKDLVRVVSMQLLESLQLVARGGKRSSFSIPKKLWRGWRRRKARRNNFFRAAVRTIGALLSRLFHGSIGTSNQPRIR